ncbi:alpha/beta hydrolase family protein [Saccharopolyspora rosea]|uniref:Alpha/beta fold hydrolase n=1 Tax=Saccharopolyspora rosea TaxID=524884 RepID=A0ABW3FMQ6_9PSEU|nr:alpha/beta fold hydrolase [Saccharopolyspora rosea]
MDDTPPDTVLARVPAGAHELTVRAVLQDDPTSPVILLLPAMGVPARYYRRFVGNLHAHGLSVVTFDLRGQGESAPLPARGVRFAYQDLIDDVDAVIDVIASALPGAPRFLLGHSLGGQLGMLHTASRPGRVRGVVLVASGSAWYAAFPGIYRLRTLFGPQLVAGLARVLGYWPGHRLGFGGRQPVGLVRDWARQSRTGRYVLAGSSTNYEAALRSVDVPLLTVTVSGDRLAPQSSVDHLAGKAIRARRVHKHYSRTLAGADQLGHFSWVRNGAELSRWIREWVTEVHDLSLQS